MIASTSERAATAAATAAPTRTSKRLRLRASSAAGTLITIACALAWLAAAYRIRPL